MAESFIQLPTDGSGKMARAQTSTQGINTVYQPVDTIADSAGNMVTTTAVGTQRGLDINIAGSNSGISVTNSTVTTVTSVTASVAAAGNATFNLVGGSYTGTYVFVFEATVDGSNWQSIVAVREDGVTAAAGDQITGSAGAGPTHQWTTGCPGFTSVRVRSTAVPGTITTGITVSIAPGPFLIEPTPFVSSAMVDGQKATYSATASALAGVSGDIGQLIGSATKTIRVTKVRLTGTAGTAAAFTVTLNKRSTANSSGTTVAMTAVPHDSQNAAATSVATAYSAAPTQGTTVGAIVADRIVLPTTTASAAFIEWEFGNRPGTQAIVLRGVAQAVAVTLSAAPTTGVLNLEFEWTEESL